MRALIVVIVLAGIASAAPKVDPAVQAKADALFVKGQTSYQEGKFQAAITQFKQAYELVRDPIYLFNIAQSYRKVGDCALAHENYTQYLAESPNAENKDKVTQWVQELQPCVDQRQREQQEAARRAQEEAERKRREDEANRNITPSGERDPGRGYRIAGIALGGVGVVGIGVGVYYAVRGADLKAQVAELCAMSCQWDGAEVQSLHRAGESANTRSWIGYIGGGIAVVGGAALYWYGRTRVETVMITPTEGGASVSARMRF